MTRLTVLGLFIVHSINRGICTSYDLQRRGGVSLGASTPALKRLERAGVIARTTVTTAQRKRFEFNVTIQGNRQFRRDWREYLLAEEPVDDIDSILRILDLASHNGASRKEIGDFLDRVITSRTRLAKLANVATKSQSIARREYRDLRERFDAKRTKFEAAVLAELRQSIFEGVGKRSHRPSRVRRWPKRRE